MLEGIVEALDGLGDELEVEVLGLLGGELALGGRDGGASSVRTALVPAGR